MATLAEIHALVAGNPDLRQRFLAGRLSAAWGVINEDPATADHDARLLWASAIIADYTWQADAQYRRFCSNATIQNSASASTDNDILWVIGTLVTTWGLDLVPAEAPV